MNFSMMIGLAVGIDYSLFIVSRYREERVEGKDALAAIENTMSTAGQGRVPLRADRRAGARRGVPRAGHGVPVDGARHDPVGRRRRARRRSRCCPRCSSRSATASSSRRGKKDPDIVAESRWARWTGVALRRPGTVLAIGLVAARRARRSPRSACTSACPAPASSTRATPAATATTCSSTRSGPARPHRRSSPSPPPTRATVVRIAAADPGVVDARVVTAPAATGRVVVRVTGSTAVDDSRTATLVDRLRDRLDDRGARRRGSAAPPRRTATSPPCSPDARRYAIGLILIVAFVLLLIVFRSLVDRASRRS